MIDKKGIKYLLIIFSFLFLPFSEVFAQFNYSCYDTLRQPNIYHPCDILYDPQCGCDGITYRNPCSAEFHGGLSVYGYESGICGEIDVYMVSNYVSEYIEYYIYQIFNGSLNVAIYDIYGTVYFFDSPNFGLKSTLSRQIPVQNLRHGVYFLVVFYNGEPISRKFVKTIRY
ncbi:MAG: T9SS type A sorting domain-containing protein [Bacteroidia bacterium]